MLKNSNRPETDVSMLLINCPPHTSWTRLRSWETKQKHVWRSFTAKHDHQTSSLNLHYFASACQAKTNCRTNSVQEPIVPLLAGLWLRPDTHSMATEGQCHKGCSHTHTNTILTDTPVQEFVSSIFRGKHFCLYTRWKVNTFIPLTVR